MDNDRLRVGEVLYALDYQELVCIVSIEGRSERVSLWRLTIERLSGEKTFNYPTYLLSDV